MFSYKKTEFHFDRICYRAGKYVDFDVLHYWLWQLSKYIGTMGTGRWHSINMIVLFLIWYSLSNRSQMEHIAFR